MKVNFQREPTATDAGASTSTGSKLEIANITSLGTNDALAMLNQKLAALVDIENAPWATNGNTDGCGITSQNLKDITDIETLLRLDAMITQKEEYYTKAADKYGLASVKAFKFNGYTKEEWEKDIKQRIAIITQTESRERLTQYKNRLESFQTEQEKKDNLFRDMMNDPGLKNL